MITYKSNLTTFFSLLGNKKREAYKEIGEVGVRYIKAETPVRTGNLRDRDDYEIEDTLYFTNDAYYAAFVELGTYKQASNPFMRRGIVRGTPEFTNILVRKLKV